jgi:lysozyme family protein
MPISTKYSEAFEQAFEHTVGLEVGSYPNGGYTDDPLDAGGETKWGISKRAHPQLDIKNLTEDEAKEIYHREYWSSLGLDHIDPQVAQEVFDTAVNMGTIRSTLILQRALAYFGAQVARDGVLGPRTREATWAVRPDDLLKVLNALQFLEYERIVSENPSQHRFARGWLKRIEFPVKEAA